MKISARARYGLRIMLDIAANSRDFPRSIKDIALSQQISEKFISQLVIPLRQAGYIRSTRGIQGGLQISRKPELITLLNIVETMEGPISVLDCVSCTQVCPRQDICRVSGIWGGLNACIRDYLQKITLKDILEETRTSAAATAISAEGVPARTAPPQP